MAIVSKPISRWPKRCWCAIALLKRLPPGTELFWLDDERLEGAHELTANIALPEASVVEIVENHCRQLEIQLHTSQ
jgi:hypothetical protein